MSILGQIFGRDYIRAGDLHYQRGQLERAAELYLKARRYEQAAGIFDQLGQTDRAVEVYHRAGMHLKAGELLSSKGRAKDAVPHFEAAGAYRQAAEACLEARQKLRAGRYFEEAAIYGRAAECFAEAGDMEQALRVWGKESAQLRTERGGRHDPVLDRRIRQLDLKRADLLAKLSRFGDAARVLQELGMAERAARMFERAELPGEAARAYLEAGLLEPARKAAERSGEVDEALLAEVYRRSGRHADAGDLYLRLGRYEAAAQAYEEGGATAKAAAVWEKADEPTRAAELFLTAGRSLDAGRCFALAGLHLRAADAFSSAGEHEEAGNAYLAAEEPLRAADSYRKAGLSRPARDVLDDVPPGSPQYGAAMLALLPMLLDDGEIEAARERLRALEEGPDAAAIPEVELLYWQARLAEAAGRWEQAAAGYRKVHAVESGFRDIEMRIARVARELDRSRSGAREVSREQPSLAASEPLPDVGLEALESPAIAEPGPTAATAASAPAVEEPAVVPAGLPFEVEERLPSWWNDVQIARILDRRQQRELLAASFPSSWLAAEGDSFRRSLAPVVGFQHPAILKLEEVLLTDDTALLLYEPFRGQALARQLSRRPLPPVTALHLLVQICDALVNAHKLGLTHRWLSPATILLDSAARAKLTGLGMADLLGARDSTSRAYRSPEAEAGTPLGPAGDVYSLGLLGAELLQAALPAERAHNGVPDPAAVGWPAEVEEAVPTSARALLLRCLATEPIERPSAEELKAALSAIGLVPGQILANRYEILGELGRGGMSRVYRARDCELGDEVAIKTVLSPAFGRSEDEERLLREVQICRRITHPNVVRVHDFGRFPSGIFVIMELLDGPGLDTVIQQEAPLPLARVKQIVGQIAGALGEAHRMEIVHRDLKPGNVILAHGRVKVLDFGIARMGEASDHLTRTGQVIGSPLYMSPEQIQGKGIANTCDLYALGVIAYTLLAGREPFVGDTTTAVVLKHLHEPPPDLHTFRPELPEEWIAVVARLLAKQPEERYQSAEELVAALDPLPE